MVTQERINQLIREIFSKPILIRKRKHKRWSIPLPDNWDVLRGLVIERDGVCVECGDSGHSVHHIDRDRTNNELDNLSYLCWLCHRGKHH